MEIYQLRTFVAVARHGHLTRAAQQLCLSQPAVSKQIKALELELGMALLERVPTGVVLTRAGRELLPLFLQSVETAQKITDLAASLLGDLSGTIQLGTIIDPDSLRLGLLLAEMVKTHPHVDITLHHGISGSILRRIVDGDLDAGFYLGEPDNPEIDGITLRHVNYVIIAPLSFADRISTAGLDELVHLPWIGPNLQSSQHRLVTRLFSARGLPQPDKVVTVDQESSMISLVRSGVGLCLMREEIVQAAVARGELVIRREDDMSCPLSFLVLKDRMDERKITAIREAVVRIHIDHLRT